MVTCGMLYRHLCAALEPQEGPEARHTARELLSLASGMTQAELFARQTDILPVSVVNTAMELAGRIAAGEPLAYILGKWSFFGLELTVTPDVLIPRDDTMAVVELALELQNKLPAEPRILDLCTGSGCIGLALASRFRGARITLADLSEKALKVAKLNASNLRMTGSVTCIRADVKKQADPFLGQFDLIISNPPYITAEDMETLQPSVGSYEPHMALYGGEDGLEFYRAIAQNFHAALKSGGYMALEFGMGQEESVCEILRQNGFEIKKLKKDTGSIIRAALAQKKERNHAYEEGNHGNGVCQRQEKSSGYGTGTDR